MHTKMTCNHRTALAPSAMQTSRIRLSLELCRRPAGALGMGLHLTTFDGHYAMRASAAHMSAPAEKLVQACWLPREAALERRKCRSCAATCGC